MGQDQRNITQTVTVGQGWRLFSIALIADLIAIVIYVTVGRASHDESLSATGLLTTAWPFILGLLGGYLGAILTRWPATTFRGGAVIVIKTLILGLVLRYGIQGDGTAFSFIVVTVLVLTALMFGWRLVATIPLSRTNTPVNPALPS